MLNEVDIALRLSTCHGEIKTSVFWTKFQKEVPLFLEVPGFPNNTGWVEGSIHRPYSVQIKLDCTSRLAVSIQLYNTGLWQVDTVPNHDLLICFTGKQILWFRHKWMSLRRSLAKRIGPSVL